MKEEKDKEKEKEEEEEEEEKGVSYRKSTTQSNQCTHRVHNVTSHIVPRQRVADGHLLGRSAVHSCRQNSQNNSGGSSHILACKNNSAYAARSFLLAKMVQHY